MYASQNGPGYFGPAERRQRGRSRASPWRPRRRGGRRGAFGLGLFGQRPLGAVFHVIVVVLVDGRATAADDARGGRAAHAAHSRLSQ